MNKPVGTLIVGVSRNGVIGKDNTIPWTHPADLKRFRALTSGGTIIMGRKTFESIGRALPKRRNIVISRTPVAVEGVETFMSLLEALETVKEEEKVWYIGGRGIYEEAMLFAAEIDVTIVPETIERVGHIVEFPWVNPLNYEIKDITHDNENHLVHVRYSRAV